MTRLLLLPVFLLPVALRAEAPVASYLFPAGGQRGTTVAVKVGGLFLHDRCNFELLGPGVTAPAELQRTPTLWLEGPVLPLPDSQRQEDYPRDMAGSVRLAADAPLGVRPWRVWTSQGVTPARRFVVGDLPEVIEKEVAGAPLPHRVALPITANGRMFPHEDIDIWEFELRKGQSLTARVEAAALGSPLDARLEVRDPTGRVIAENDDGPSGADPVVRIGATRDGVYQVRIHDINFKGSQAHVYRLTLTNETHVDAVFPLGCRRGTRTNFRLSGQGVPATLIAVDVPKDAGTPFAHQFDVGGKKTNPVVIDVDDLPEVVEGDTKPLVIPVVANGVIGKPRETDRWSFAAKKGEAIDIELRAQRLGSPLLGVLLVEDAQGKQLARAEGSGGKADPTLRFTAPADGTFQVVVAERFPHHGSMEYAYRLKLTKPAEPDFQVRVGLDALTLPRGGQVTLPVSVEALGGFRQPIALQLDGLPDDVTVTGSTLTAGQTTANLVLKATATAKLRSVPLTLRATAKLGDKETTRLAVATSDPSLTSLRLAVALPTPFKVVGQFVMGWASRGSVGKRRFSIERNGFTGPLTVSLADRQARHLQGAVGPTITVPAGATEFEYPITLPPWMEIGRTCRVCVMAVGVVVEPDGSKHTVSFNSINQNEQYVAVIEAGQLELTLETPSVRAEAGKSVEVKCKLTRGKGVEGPVRLELLVPDHVRGATAGAVEVPAAQSTGTLMLRFAGDKPGPFNAPLIVRATLTGTSGPITAEAKLDVGE